MTTQFFHGYEVGLEQRLLAGVRLEPAGRQPALQTLKDVVAVPGMRGLFDTKGYRIDAANWQTLPPDAPEHLRRKLFARTPGRIEVPTQVEQLPGRVFYGGMLIPQYGHFLLDSLARLWALEAESDLPILFIKHPYWQEYPGFVRLIFDALGISARIITVDRPTFVRELVCPAPAFEYRTRVFQGADRPHTFAAERLSESAVATTWRRPVYLSRGGLASDQRKYAAEPELERELTRRGVDVIRPESLTLPEQISLFERAGLILGTIGSAFHTALLSRQSGNTLGILTWGRSIDNYLLVDAVKSHRSHYFQSLSVEGEGRNFNLDVGKSLELFEAAGLLPSIVSVSMSSRYSSSVQ